MSNTKYAKATGGTPIISWIPNQIKAVISAMDSCIQSISPTYEQTKILLFKTELQVKKELLNDAMKILKTKNIVFEINTLVFEMANLSF